RLVQSSRKHLLASAQSTDGSAIAIGGLFWQDACGLRVFDGKSRVQRFPPKKAEQVAAPFPTEGQFPQAESYKSFYPAWVPLPDGTAIEWDGSRLLKVTKDRKQIRTLGPGEVRAFAVTPDGQTAFTYSAVPDAVRFP